MEKSKRLPQILLKEEYRRLRNSNAFIYLDDLKATWKHFGNSIAKLKKNDIVEKLDDYYKDDDIVINNSEDFYTFQPINEIPKNYLFTFTENGFNYGFDIRSFKKLIEHTRINPYTRNEIPDKVVDEFNSKYKNLIKMKQMKEYKKEELTAEQLYNQRVLGVFQKMDSLEVVASGTKLEWFTNLSFISLKNLYKVLEDIWNYRTQMTQLQKNKIVPDGNIFKHNIYQIMNMNIENQEKLKDILLDTMDKLVSSGLTNEDKSTGCYYILIAFTEVNPIAAIEMPWLVQY
jgi:hypothetical protein